MQRLSPLRHAFLIGYRRGLNKARAELRSAAQSWETEIVGLQDDYAELINELRDVRDERAVEEALVERATYLDMWLH